MPQRLSNLCKKPTISLHFDQSTNKPELAILVAGIFARWAWIEHQISVLLLHILGAEVKPALAMFSVLSTQRLQVSALGAAAKAALPPDHYEVFTAVMSVLDCVQKDRNRLAHWVWGTCPELPHHLLLANPESLKAREIQREETLARVKNTLWWTADRMKELYALDHSEIFTFSKDDLERTKRDLGEAVGMLVMFQVYLNPRYPDDAPPKDFYLGTRAQALDELSKLRLFREALERARDTKNNPQANSSPHKPTDPS